MNDLDGLDLEIKAFHAPLQFPAYCVGEVLLYGSRRRKSIWRLAAGLGSDP